MNFLKSSLWDRVPFLFFFFCFWQSAYWIFMTFWFFSPRVSAVMLRQFILNFCTGLIPRDGNSVCFSFNQDLHIWDLEAFIAYISWIINRSSQSSEVARKFLLISRNWILLDFFLIHFDPSRIFYIEVSGQPRSPIHREKFGALDLCEHTGPSWQWVYFPAFLYFALLHLSKMYERHKRRYSLCDISKVDRTVDVVLLKVRGRGQCLMH